MKFTALTCSCVLLTGAIASAQNDFGDILFIGDSITEANGARNGNGGHSWRYEFWKNMVDSGDTFGFTGSRTDNWNTSATYPTYQSQTFENRHEAIWGTTTMERSSTLAGQYASLAADTAFLHLGGNNFAPWAPVPSDAFLNGIVSDIESMITGVRTENPEADFHILSVLPRYISDSDNDGINDVPSGINPSVIALNLFLEDFAIAETTADSTISYIDLHSYSDPTWFYDGVHPNKDGEIAIANLVFDAVDAGARVPEPSSAILAMISLALLAGRRRRA